MAANANIVLYISKAEFVNEFKLQHFLALRDPGVMGSYKSYKATIRRLRRESIQYLREKGMSGRERAEYNQAVEKLARASHLKYLYHKDWRCKICTFPIYSIRDATIDHTIPRAHGGSNSLDNKQIAHGPCNVMKGDKLDFKMQKVV